VSDRLLTASDPADGLGLSTAAVLEALAPPLEPLRATRPRLLASFPNEIA
jgi:hypothetical protein